MMECTEMENIKSFQLIRVMRVFVGAGHVCQNGGITLKTEHGLYHIMRGFFFVNLWSDLSLKAIEKRSKYFE